MYRFEENNADSAGYAVGVELTVKGLAGKARPQNIYRIDREHANAYRAWLSLGSPASPTHTQIEEIAAKAKLVAESGTVIVENGAARITLTLPPNAMALVMVGED